MRIKDLLKKSRLVRETVRRRRLGGVHHDWTTMLGREADEWHRLKEKAAQGKAILLATSAGASGNGAVTNLESMLSVALTQRGAAVHLLLCDGVLPACQECDIGWYPDEGRFGREGPSRNHCDSCFKPAQNAYAALGLTIHRYSDMLTPEDFQAAERIADDRAVADLRAFVWEGLNLGEQALAGALRYYGRADLSGRHVEAVTHRYLMAGLLTAMAMRRLLDQHDFAAVVAHHGIYVPQGIVGQVARERDVRFVTWHTAYRKRSFIFSHGDTYHHTMMTEPPDTWESMDWTPDMDRQITDYLGSRWWGLNDWVHFVGKPEVRVEALSKKLNIDLTKPTIGMLTNVMWDAQLHYPSNAFPNMLDWVLKTIAYFAKRPELQLLIRVHPAEVRGTLLSRQPIIAEISRAFPELPSNVILIPPESSASTYALMEQCDSVLIYGTKAGVEVTSLGIPTIVAGEAWIRDKGITSDAQSEAHYTQLLDQLPLNARLTDEQVLRARKYAYHFFFRRMVPLETVEPHKGHPPFTLRLSRLTDLAPGSDVGLDVVCDGILEGAPFVFPYEEQPEEVFS